eukprot:m.220550 g.220550  ORF g.220550 m.220550 type:complete len:419 (+) comp10398_c0_seq1:59-1315(+)
MKQTPVLHAGTQLIALLILLAGSQRVAAKRLPVHREHVDQAAGLVLEAVGSAKLLDDLRHLGVLVARHEGEDVVLQLVLHATEEILGDKVRADDVACAAELHGSVARLPIEHHLLALMGERHNKRDQEAADQDRRDRDGKRQAQAEIEVRRQDREGERLVVALGPRPLDRLGAPRDVQERIQGEEVDVLVPAEMVVERSRGCPEEEERLVVDVGVEGDVVGEHVVRVVLVRPPGPVEAVDPAAHKADHERVVRTVARMVHVVAKPAGLLHRHTDEDRGDDGMGGRDVRADHKHGHDEGKQASLVEYRALKPAVLLELHCKVAESLVRGCGVDGGVLAIRRALLQLANRLLGMQGVERSSGIEAVVVLKDLRASRMELAKLLEIMPLAIDAHTGRGHRCLRRPSHAESERQAVRAARTH